MAKQFTILNHPEVEPDGTQLYDLFELTRAESVMKMVNPDTGRIKKAPAARQYIKRLTNITLEQAKAYVEEHGEWDTE